MKKRLWLIFFLIFVFSSPVLAWEDCPYGLVDDSYPGQCGRYVDANQDQICDHSQPEPEKILISPEPVFGSETPASVGAKTDYLVLPLSLGLVLAYLASVGLVSAKIITKLNQGRFWNVILAAAFLGVGFSGLILALGLKIAWPFRMIFWHVEMGVVFVLLALIHLIWHFPYYLNLVKKKKK